MSSMMGSLIDNLKRIISMIGNLPQGFANLFNGILEYIFSLFYLIFIAISYILSIVQIIFYKLAGVGVGTDGTVWFNGTPTDNMVLGFIFSGPVINAFISMLILSVVLLIVFTFIAIIKSEFALDLKGSAKAPIIGRALKALAYFVVVPVTSVLGIYAVQGLTRTIFNMAGSSATEALFIRPFTVASYEANRVRYDDDFYDAISHGWNNNDGDFSGVNRDALATSIDQAFIQGASVKKTTKEKLTGGYANYVEDKWTNKDGYVFLHAYYSDRWSGNVDAHMTAWAYPENEVYAGDTFNPLKPGLVHYYYSMYSFNYLLGIGSILVITYYMLITALALIKRAFDIVILMIMAPPMIALEPLDNGDARKKWTKEMYSRVISVVVSVFAMNMYFVLVPVFCSISLFPQSKIATSVIGTVSSTSAISSSGVAITAAVILTILGPTIVDLIFQLFVVIIGAMVVKNASSMVASMLGATDLIKEGGDMAKSIGQTAMKGAKMVGGVKALKIAHDAKRGKGKVGKEIKKETDAAGEQAYEEALAEGKTEEQAQAAKSAARAATEKKLRGKAHDAAMQQGLKAFQGVLPMDLLGQKYENKKMLKDLVDLPSKERDDLVKAEKMKNYEAGSTRRALARKEKEDRNSMIGSLVTQEGGIKLKDGTIVSADGIVNMINAGHESENREDLVKAQKKAKKDLNSAERDLAIAEAAHARAGTTMTAAERDTYNNNIEKAREAYDKSGIAIQEFDERAQMTAAVKAGDMTGLAKIMNPYDETGKKKPALNAEIKVKLEGEIKKVEGGIDEDAQTVATIEHAIQEFKNLTHDWKGVDENKLNDAIAKLNGLVVQANGMTTKNKDEIEDLVNNINKAIQDAKKN